VTLLAHAWGSASSRLPFSPRVARSRGEPVDITVNRSSVCPLRNRVGLRFYCVEGHAGASSQAGRFPQRALDPARVAKFDGASDLCGGTQTLSPPTLSAASGPHPCQGCGPLRCQRGRGRVLPGSSGRPGRRPPWPYLTVKPTGNRSSSGPTTSGGVLLVTSTTSFLAS
jgi:hypothetical protein